MKVKVKVIGQPQPIKVWGAIHWLYADHWKSDGLNDAFAQIASSQPRRVRHDNTKVSMTKENVTCATCKQFIARLGGKSD